MTDPLHAVFPEFEAWKSELESIRHAIHAEPDLGFETAHTVERLVGILKGWGIEAIDAETVPGGLLVLIEGAGPGRTIGLRADIDALPMDDKSENPWKSTIPGRSHACGHDGHATWLLGALRWLHAHRTEFTGRVLGIFQPAEEIGRGAAAVCEAGVLTKYAVAEIYGAHGEPTLSPGEAALKTGPLQASTDFFYVTVRGVGCHGGRPHMGVDPIPVAASLVSTLQTVVSRKVNPVENAVLSICSLNAGRFNAPNVIPPEATLSGTVRTFSEDVRDLIEEQIHKMSEGVAAANGCTAEVRYDRLTPSVNNHPETTRAWVDFARRRFGEAAAVTEYPVTMGGEDFAEYQLRIPGTIARIGIRDEAHAVSLHHPAFDFNDKVIGFAATLLAGIAFERLGGRL